MAELESGWAPRPQVGPTPPPARETVVAHEVESPAEPAIPDSVAMPAWLDEVIARKQAPNPEPEGPRPQVVSAKLPAPEIPPPPPPTPLRKSPPSIAPPLTSTGLQPDFIPNRLRQKLNAVESRKRTSAAMPWFISAVVLALVAMAMILVVRFEKDMPWAAKSPPKLAAKQASTGTEFPATGATTSSDSSRAASSGPATGAQPASRMTATRSEPLPAASTPVSVGLPPTPARVVKPEPVKPVAVRHAVVAKPAASSRVYGVVIGTYFDEARATEVARKTAAPLGMPTRIMAVTEDGAPMYRAVVGRFDNRALADLAASRLAESGASEARVIALGAAPNK